MTITNLTIKKLTTRELNDLDCFSTLGVGLYRGNLKAKVKLQNKYYPRTTTLDGVEVFELEGWEAHFIPLADEDKVPPPGPSGYGTRSFSATSLSGTF